MKIRRHTSNNKQKLILGICFLLVLFLISLSVVYANKDDEIIPATDTPHQTSDTTQKYTETELSLQRCFSLQENRDACYFNLCENRNFYLCAEDILESIVKISGPEQGMDALNDIMASSLFSIQTDGHLLAHVLGTSTLKYFGLNSESFLRCPNDFRFGCQHGFFENAFGKETDPIRVAIGICGHEYYSSCYHGVGHGLMFYESYNLMHALSLCDQLFSKREQYSCYAGVFMENISGFLQNIDGDFGFSKDDIFAPCNRIEDTYQYICWQEHGAYILHHTNWSIKEASRVCLNAEEHIRDCMSSLGHFTLAQREQRMVQGLFQGTFLETAAYLCTEFPSEYLETCQSTVIENLIARDRGDSSQASEFCLAFQSSVHDCFKKIGAELLLFTQDNNAVMQGCDIASEEYRESCYQGAGIDSMVSL